MTDLRAVPWGPCPACARMYLDAGRMTDHLRNCSVFRNDVTARHCPALVSGDNSTHHLVPRRVGEMRGRSVYEHVCSGCGEKATALRSDSAIEAAIRALMGSYQ